MKHHSLKICSILVLMLVMVAASGGVAYADNPPQKVEVCHVEGNGTYHLITIAYPAFQTHLNHGDSTPGGDAPSMPGFLFTASCEPVAASCQAIREVNPSASDGEYTRVWNAAGPAFSVYCFDMAGTPTEYLTLQNIGGAANFAQYTAYSWTNVRTSYDRIRLDIDSLMVDISDQTFSTSTGYLMHGPVEVTSMPYGVAMACESPYLAAGVANIDLTGTPFRVVDPFVVGGYLASGSASFSANEQVVDLVGGGYCGWITPDPWIFNPFNAAGGFQLDLGFLP